MCTGQLLVIAVEIVILIAIVSSWLSSPTAPLHRTSIQGRPEHINMSPPIVAVPVVDRVEKFPGSAPRSAARCRARRRTRPARQGVSLRPARREGLARCAAPKATAPAGLYPDGVTNTAPAATGIDAPPDVAAPTSLTNRIADELLATR